jgi:hypothetical protein
MLQCFEDAINSYLINFSQRHEVQKENMFVR